MDVQAFRTLDSGLNGEQPVDSGVKLSVFPDSDVLINPAFDHTVAYSNRWSAHYKNRVTDAVDCMALKDTGKVYPNSWMAESGFQFRYWLSNRKGDRSNKLLKEKVGDDTFVIYLYRVLRNSVGIFYSGTFKLIAIEEGCDYSTRDCTVKPYARLELCGVGVEPFPHNQSLARSRRSRTEEVQELAIQETFSEPDWLLEYEPCRHLSYTPDWLLSFLSEGSKTFTAVLETKYDIAGVAEGREKMRCISQHFDRQYDVFAILMGCGSIPERVIVFERGDEHTTNWPTFVNAIKVFAEESVEERPKKRLRLCEESKSSEGP